MVFSSPVFLFLFLPITLLLYYAASSFGSMRARNLVLLAVSACFYAFGGLECLCLLILSVIVNWTLGVLMIRHQRERGVKRVYFVIGLIYNISILFFFKYLNLFADTGALLLGKLTGTEVLSPLPPIVLPIGISFFTFQIMSYLIDVYRGTVACQKNIWDLALYIMLFPQLIAGPIVRYSDVETEIANRRSRLLDVYEGAYRFFVGFIKKVLLANAMGKAADLAFVLPEGRGMVYAWAGLLCYSLQLYLDFWAYSDMAIGLGRIFGFHFPENFNYPYTAKSIGEFWRRWHMTLSGWFRDYVYIPLGGNRNGLFKTCRNLMIVFALTGIWHGANWTFLLWGIYYGIFLVLERIGLGAFLQRLPSFFRHAYVLLIVGLGWVLFRADGLSAAFGYIRDLFSGTLLGTHERELGELLVGGKFQLQLLISLLFCTPFFSGLYARLGKSRFAAVGDGIVLFFFFLAMCEMMAGSYNPFIYFRF